MFCRMHNGVVGGFMKIRRALTRNLSDAAYNTIQSFHSDSAVCFGIFLNFLPDIYAQHQPQVLLKALEVSVIRNCTTTALNQKSYHPTYTTKGSEKGSTMLQTSHILDLFRIMYASLAVKTW